jgi:hypothetical protein
VWVLLALWLLIGLDLTISHARWKRGIRDLNPIVEHFRKTNGPTVGLLALGALNLLVLAAASLWAPGFYILLGSKLTLLSFQLRSFNVNCNSC